MAQVEIGCNHCNQTGFCNCESCLEGAEPHPTISGVCAICVGSGFLKVGTTVSGEE